MTGAGAETVAGAATAAGAETSTRAGTSAGPVLAWGNNWSGQLGAGTTDEWATAPSEAGVPDATQVAAGLSAGYALRANGTVWAWGKNDRGQLGDGTTVASRTPVQVKGLTDVVAIESEGDTAYAVRDDGTVWAWGSNYGYELGIDPRPAYWTAEARQVEGLTDVETLAVSDHSAVVVRADGTVWGWGADGGALAGACGGTTCIAPARIPGLSDVADVALDASGGLALRSDGTVLAWGASTNGRRGNGTTAYTVEPVQVSGLSGVEQIAVGRHNGYALLQDGSLWAWGKAINLGTGATIDSTVPVPVSGLNDVTSVSAAVEVIAAVLTDGTVRVWGNGSAGQFGRGLTAASTVPAQVAGLTGVRAVAAGYLTQFAVGTSQPPPLDPDVDSDGDGLLNGWETDGLTVELDGVEYFVDLPAMGANPRRKDIFVEIDYMTGGGHSHKPSKAAIDAVVNSFASSNIQLHVDYGPRAPLTYGEAATWDDLSRSDAIPHTEWFGGPAFLGLGYSWRAFDEVKEDHFDPARAAVFHYNLWVHHMEVHDKPYSGRSRDVEGGASDFIVSLGDWGRGDLQAQSGTFMHELGHNLGLGHGGSDDVNRKPNYLSVMNYDFQFEGMVAGYPGRTFDYSFAELPSIDERDLDEHEGIGITADLGLRTRWHCADTEDRRSSRSQPIDWDCDGTIESSVSGSINKDSRLEVLHGHNDWSNLVFTGGAIGRLGVAVELPEETFDVEPEPDYQIYLEVVGGAPLVESAPVATGGPFHVGDDVAMTLPFTVTSGNAGNMTAEWLWGDGATSAGTVTPGGSPVVAGTHAYTEAGTYSVTVTITGPDGTATSSAATVVVQAEEVAGGGASALGWQTMQGPGSRSTRVYLAMDARTVPFGPGTVGASLVRRPDSGLTVLGTSVERIVVVGTTAVVDSRVMVNGRPGYAQRVTLVDGQPGRVRIQVWDPAKGGPESAAARVLDTTSGAGPASVPTMLVDVRG